MFQPRFADEPRRPSRRQMLFGLLAACVGLSRMGPPSRVVDLGTHLSVNGWVVDKRELSGGFGG